MISSCRGGAASGGKVLDGNADVAVHASQQWIQVRREHLIDSRLGMNRCWRIAS